MDLCLVKFKRSVCGQVMNAVMCLVVSAGKEVGMKEGLDESLEECYCTVGSDKQVPTLPL